MVDVGARYAFVYGTAPASLRMSLTNVFNHYGFELAGAGAYELIPGRLLTVRIVMDL
jgi:iron complex outermembrane receptor protein